MGEKYSMKKQNIQRPQNGNGVGVFKYGGDIFTPVWQENCKKGNKVGVIGQAGTKSCTIS